MTNQEIINAAASTVEELRKEYIPRDTGNMADNALKYKVEGKYIIIYFDTNISPYIPYTNEPWVSPKWKGKKNPNLYWWDTFAYEFILRFKEKLRGKIND